MVCLHVKIDINRTASGISGPREIWNFGDIGFSGIASPNPYKSPLFLHRIRADMSPAGNGVLMGNMDTRADAIANSVGNTAAATTDTVIDAAAAAQKVAA